MPIFVQFGMAAKLIGGVIGKNWMWLLPFLAGIIALAYYKGEHDAAVQRVIAEAKAEVVESSNEGFLKNQLDIEKEARENAESLATELRGELETLSRNKLEREQYLDDLERQLSNMNLRDDVISPRTRELLRRLNQRTRNLQAQEAITNE